MIMDLNLAASASRNEKPFPWWKTLPFDFDDVRVSVGHRPSGFRFSEFIINIEARFEGLTIGACGEAKTSDAAMTKAIAELVERTTLMKWHRMSPSVSTSNGWAAHEDIPQSKLNAVLELTERDAVLAQWYSAHPFIEISPSAWPLSLKNWASEELSKSEFPIMRLLMSTEGIGPSLTCLFLNDSGYGVSGHATKVTLTESIEAAIAETCRAAHHVLRRSFWKDALELFKRTNERVQPGGHAVYYAYQDIFPSWMFGKSIEWQEADGAWRKRMTLFMTEELPRFNFQVALENPLVVGFASHPQIFDLSWGTTNAENVLNMTASRRFAVPLTEQILNHQPHIVS